MIPDTNPVLTQDFFIIFALFFLCYAVFLILRLSWVKYDLRIANKELRFYKQQNDERIEEIAKLKHFANPVKAQAAFDRIAEHVLKDVKTNIMHAFPCQDFSCPCGDVRREDLRTVLNAVKAGSTKVGVERYDLTQRLITKINNFSTDVKLRNGVPEYQYGFLDRQKKVLDILNKEESPL
jgi:hypothetical protein